MIEYCEKCKKKVEHDKTMSMGRAVRVCRGCHNMKFEDQNPGGVNTTESLLH